MSDFVNQGIDQISEANQALEVPTEEFESLVLDEKVTLPSHHLLDLPSIAKQDYGATFEVGSSKFYVVCDGHGKSGTLFAVRAVNTVQNYILEQRACLDEDDLSSLLNNTFARAEEVVKDELSSHKGGSTMSILVLRPGRDSWVAHVGDSDVRRIDKKSKVVEQLTSNHSSASISEFERIRKDGANPEVTFEYDSPRRGLKTNNLVFDMVDDTIVEMQVPPTNEIYYKNMSRELATYFVVTLAGERHKLAVTRTLGDWVFKAHGATAVPDIRKCDPLGEDQLMIIASDGFWDCYSSETLVTMVEAGSEKWNDYHSTTSTRLFGRHKDDSFGFFIF